MQRLWISSLTSDAIRQGFGRLRDGREFDPLADAARGRSRADWLVGMNLSRAYTLDFNEDLSVGRVQTPTLAMLVERELAIRAFVPEDSPGSAGHLLAGSHERDRRGVAPRVQGHLVPRLLPQPRGQADQDGAERQARIGPRRGDGDRGRPRARTAMRRSSRSAPRPSACRRRSSTT